MSHQSSFIKSFCPHRANHLRIQLGLHFSRFGTSLNTDFFILRNPDWILELHQIVSHDWLYTNDHPEIMHFFIRWQDVQSNTWNLPINHDTIVAQMCKALKWSDSEFV